MRAWQVDRVIKAGEMQRADIPLPQFGPGEYVAYFKAAGTNFLDTPMLRGRYQHVPADLALALLGVNYPISRGALHDKARLQPGDVRDAVPNPLLDHRNHPPGGATHD
jgi:hypothetical protein